MNIQEEARAAAEKQYPLPHGRKRGDGTPEGVAQVAYERGYIDGAARERCGHAQTITDLREELAGLADSLDEHVTHDNIHAALMRVIAQLENGFDEKRNPRLIGHPVDAHKLASERTHTQ